MGDKDNGSKQEQDNHVVFEFRVVERANGSLSLEAQGQFQLNVDRSADMMYRWLRFFEGQRSAMATVALLAKVSQEQQTKPHIVRPGYPVN